MLNRRELLALTGTRETDRGGRACFPSAGGLDSKEPDPLQLRR